MGKIARYLLAGAAFAGMASGGDFGPVPGGFTFSLNPLKGVSSAWYIDGREGVLRGLDGDDPYCVYGRVVAVPAGKDLGEWSCPDVTVRHLRDVDLIRVGGKCLGMVCGYDVTDPGGGATMTTDPVAECPDIVVTVSYGGAVEAVSAKYMTPGEDFRQYYAPGRVADIFLDTTPGVYEKCATARYRAQVRYWVGETARGKRRAVQFDVGNDGRWDGS